MSRHVAATVDFDDGWLDRMGRPDEVTAMLMCNQCGLVMDRNCRPDQAADQLDALAFRAAIYGWRLRKGLVACQGERDYCPSCAAALGLEPAPERPADLGPSLLDESRYRAIARGFTLVELLVVLVIVALVAAVTLPVVATTWKSRRVDAAAQLIQGELTAAVARAQRDGVAGIRLKADEAFAVVRRADGSVDPAAPLAYSRVVPLTAPAAIRDGRVSIRDTFPAGFPVGALIVEQEVMRDEGGVRVLEEPTSWAWRVRLGDRLELLGRTYTVCGPVATANPDGFVNYPAGGTGLDRGEGEAEWLMLVNGIDDDDDGSIDNGFNGRDENLDGVADDAMEWTETEVWGLDAPVVGSPYIIRPRPVPAAGAAGVELAGALIDATGWDAKPPTRSRLPVDRLSGVVDLVVHPDGRMEPASRYAPTVPAAGGLARPFLHFWICNRESVDSASPAEGRLVTVASRTGLTSGGVADPADAEGSFRAAEGGGL